MARWARGKQAACRLGLGKDSELGCRANEGGDPRAHLPGWRPQGSFARMETPGLTCQDGDPRAHLPGW